MMRPVVGVQRKRAWLRGMKGGRLGSATYSSSHTKAAYFTFLLQAHLLLLQSQLQSSWSYNVHVSWPLNPWVRFEIHSTLWLFSACLGEIFPHHKTTLTFNSLWLEISTQSNAAQVKKYLCQRLPGLQKEGGDSPLGSTSSLT